MSKAPKTKKAALHYQPYQALGQASENEEPSMDLGMSDLPLHLDPVLSGLSSNMSRNLWDDWNENDANFGMKMNEMFMDEVSTTSTASSTASANPSMHVAGLNGFNHVQNASEAATPTHEDPQKPRANVHRSLSEDIVSMLDDNDAAFAKQIEGERREMAMHNNILMFNSTAGQSMMGFQQSPQHQMHPTHMQQLHQQQMQMQQQYQQQQQQFQQAAGAINNWMGNFGGGNQLNATTNASASGKPSNPSAHRNSSNPANPTALDMAVAEGAASLIAKHSSTSASRAPSTAATSSSTTSSTTQQSAKFGFHGNRSENGKEKLGVQASASSSGGSASSHGNAASKANNAQNTDPSSTNNAGPADSSQQANAFAPGMMMNPFMMYSMMGPQGMNMMGMPMQMPLGMNMNMNGMNGANAMNGMQLPMQMQLQMQMQMAHMAQMAQLNGMGGMNGMQLPMGIPGMPLGMNMQLPLNMPMPQQVNPQSGSSGDVEMPQAPAMFPMAAVAPVSVLKPARALQPKGGRGGPGFVSIARKPEEPEVSSILKSLMDEEAKKKEKKLERNRDSARESRKKQQTYVETLENGIKRLQINRDLVRSYRWGVSGPGFGPLPCPNSPQMFDWKNRVEVVTGRTEAFSTIQNPTNFKSLMRLNRQRRTLAMQHEERQRAVWKCFVFVGRQLAAMRTRVLQVQMLRTFSGNPLAMELDAALKLTADQKLQLQCHAQQMFNQEVVELTKLFKVFFALRNEALRLNMMSPSLERYFRDACSFDQLQRLLQWTENYRAVIETELCLDEV